MREWREKNVREIRQTEKREDDGDGCVCGIVHMNVDEKLEREKNEQGKAEEEESVKEVVAHFLIMSHVFLVEVREIEIMR